MLTRRQVCREWRDEINNIIASKTSNLLLFSDRYNVRQYEFFLNLTQLDGDSNYKLVNTTHPFKNLALLIHDIKLVASKKSILERLTKTKRLVYFGEPQVVAKELKTPSWHNFMNNIAVRFSNLEAIVVHHYGYFPGYNNIIDPPSAYSRLLAVHLVQPSFFEKSRIYHHHPNFHYSGGYIFDADPEVRAITSEEERTNYNGLTQLFVHTIMHYSEDNIGTKSPAVVPLPVESYWE